MKRIVLVNCVDIDEFRNAVKDELPMILEGSEFKNHEDDNCMFVDDNPKVIVAAERFLKRHNVRYFVDKQDERES